MTTVWCEQPIHRVATAIETGVVSVSEVIDSVLDRIATRDPVLNAYTTVFDESARREALAGAIVDKNNPTKSCIVAHLRKATRPAVRKNLRINSTTSQ